MSGGLQFRSYEDRDEAELMTLQVQRNRFCSIVGQVMRFCCCLVDNSGFAVVGAELPV